MTRHRDYSAAVLIGRFQPIHNTHESIIKCALEIADKVIILVGSAYSAPSPKNPFLFEERKKLIRACFPDTVRVLIEPLRDHFYSDDMWLAQVQGVTSKYIEEGETVALMGSYKDSSSYYLNLFPQWEFVTPGVHPQMDATTLRETLFDVNFTKNWSDRGINIKISPEDTKKQNIVFDKMTPDAVSSFLRDFANTERFANLSEEFKANRAYREAWDLAPFPPTFITADTVVTCAGHLLVVKRGGNPGKGLLALPGGFVRPQERIKDAAIRELKEETRIKVDKLILASNVVSSEVFDYPERSLRGRTVTHAFHVKLKAGKLPEVKGSDDAVGAFWMPLIEVFKREEEFFEDHLAIVQKMIGGSIVP